MEVRAGARVRVIVRVNVTLRVRVGAGVRGKRQKVTGRSTSQSKRTSEKDKF